MRALVSYSNLSKQLWRLFFFFGYVLKEFVEGHWGIYRSIYIQYTVKNVIAIIYKN